MPVVFSHALLIRKNEEEENAAIPGKPQDGSIISDLLFASLSVCAVNNHTHSFLNLPVSLAKNCCLFFFAAIFSAISLPPTP